MALSKGTRLLLWITGLGALIFMAAAVAIALIMLADLPSLDQDEVWVDLELAGPISDGPRPDSVIVDPENIPLTVHDVSATLHHIAEDDNVAGIAVELNRPSMGLARPRKFATACRPSSTAARSARSGRRPTRT